MELPTINRKSIMLLTLMAALLLIMVSSCYYDNEEYLYPDPTPCDTTNVTYSGSVAPVMAANCNGCHSSSSPSAGIITDNYNSLKVVADNGKLQGAINHQSGYSPMPKGGNKLNACDLTKIDIWINAGAPNN